MKKLIVSGVFCSVLLLGGFQVASAEETTTTTTANTEMLAKIQDLMKLIADLQAKLTAARGEIKELMSDLSVGDENEDVKKIQELLASDPTIFKVKPTGYFGPLTEEAIKKFQERYGLPVTGVVDEATREVMKELRKERKEGHVPPGLVKSEEVKDRIKARLQEKWGDCVWGEKFRASDCQKGHDDDSDDEDDSDDDSSVDATRADAVAAIAEASAAIATLKADIEEMEDDADVTEDELDEVNDTLVDAQKKLADARKALYRGNYDDAVDKAEDAVETISDDSDDDSDEADDSDDEDEDDGDDDDDEDEDDAEDDD